MNYKSNYAFIVVRILIAMLLVLLLWVSTVYYTIADAKPIKVVRAKPELTVSKVIVKPEELTMYLMYNDAEFDNLVSLNLAHYAPSALLVDNIEIAPLYSGNITTKTFMHSKDNTELKYLFTTSETMVNGNLISYNYDLICTSNDVINFRIPRMIISND